VCVPAAHYGSDFLNSEVVPSAVTLLSISDVMTLRTNIAVSKNSVATTSAVTDTVRYCFDALYIKPLPAIHCYSPQGQTEGVTESEGHLVAGAAIWRRAAVPANAAAPEVVDRSSIKPMEMMNRAVPVPNIEAVASRDRRTDPGLGVAHGTLQRLALRQVSRDGG